ncbi:hypothetical protein H2203_000688 [Taxawa tesnikishii (nom. ined.)]|nr:hypothetical protein H2203_000688 [Dothideales sp. JES 119]
MSSDNNSQPLYYDIVGFDPRGVGETTPSISCFPDALSRESWLMQNEALGILGSSTDTYSFQQHWYRAKALAEGCSAAISTTSNGTSAIGEHLNTTPVIRDMLEIVEQHAHWASAGKTLSDTHRKLKYWGFSYGTIIGQTFAAMYPDKVERMVLDGVCDSEDYYNVPLSVPASHTRGPDVITWSDIKSMVRLGMYQPLQFLELVADLLTDVTYGNGSAFADFKLHGHTLSCPSSECKDAGPFSPECNPAGANGLDSSAAILCSDGEWLGDVDEERFQEYWHALQNQSRVMGDWWAHNRLSCVGWKVKAKWKFLGPFAANTSNPILWVSNTLDPVTPIGNARRMAPNYPGSVILQQEAEGHCSFAAPSLCTARTVRTYFQTGILPTPGTICPADAKPLVGTVEGVAGVDAVDENLMDAMRKVGKVFGDEAKWRRTPFF